MGEIVLVRHGQANSAADNEADYDKLSDLGHQQAAWLGDWMRSHEAPFDTIMSGTLRRQRETLDGLGYPDQGDRNLPRLYVSRRGRARHGCPTGKTYPVRYIWRHYCACSRTTGNLQCGPSLGPHRTHDLSDALLVIMIEIDTISRQISCNRANLVETATREIPKRTAAENSS